MVALLVEQMDVYLAVWWAVQKDKRLVESWVAWMVELLADWRAEKLVYEMDLSLVVSMVGSWVGMKDVRKGKWLVA